MNSTPACPHEQDVLELATLGRWPSAADQTLRDHVASCGICGDLAHVAAVLADWRDAAHDAVRVPDASRVWREAERRARAAATRRATRPVLAVEVAALAAGILLAATLGPAVWPVASTLLDRAAPSGWVAALSQSFSSLSAPLADAPGWRSVLAAPFVRWSLLALAGWAVLVPLALSLASLADRMPRPDTGHSKPAR